MSYPDEFDFTEPSGEAFSVDEILSEFGLEDYPVLPYAAENEPEPEEEQPAPGQDEYYPDTVNEKYVSPYTVDNIISSEPEIPADFLRPSAAELSSFIDDFRSGRYLDDLDSIELPQESPAPAPEVPSELPEEEPEKPKKHGFPFIGKARGASKGDDTAGDGLSSEEEDYSDEGPAAPLAGFIGSVKNSRLAGKRRARAENREKDDFVLAENERPKPIMSDDQEYEGDSEFEYTNPTAEFANGKPFSEVSFKDYLISIVMTVMYKLRGAASVVLTMEDVVEELGPEMPPKKAFKYYGRNIQPMKLRLLVCAVLLIFMGWITLGLPVTGMLKTAKTASAVVMGMQLTIMLLCLDVVTNALLNAARGRLGLDSMAVIACIATLFDAFLVSLSTFVSPHIALCFFSSLSLSGILYADMLSCCGLRKSIRVPAIGKKINVMRAEYDEKENKTHLIRFEGSAEGFVRRSEETPPDENTFGKLSLLIFAAAFIMAVVCAIANHDIQDIMYYISLFICIGTPVCGLMSFALPFLFGANKIFSSGAGICGWSGVYDIGHSDKLIITDGDLFPKGTIKLGSYRIYRSSSERRTIAYTASLLKEAGTSLAHPFIEKLSEFDSELLPVLNFEIMAGGGFKGIIDSKVILCGSSDFMHLMNVPILADHITDTSVLLAVNGELCGIFNMEYSRSPEIKRSLAKLITLNIEPTFAVRDFNITPRMLRDTFELPTDGYDFPPFAERAELTTDKGSEFAVLNSVICIDGLSPLVNTVTAGKAIFRAAKINVAVSSVGACLCMLIAFLKLLAAGTLSMSFIFMLVLFLAVPVLIVSILV